jgi:phosphatidyl-myo-inositol alpha-mannosyltransferase
MKVAIVSPYSWAHPGGVNNHVAGLSSELSRRAHDVTIIAPDGGVAPPGVRFVTAGGSLPVPANGSIAHLAVGPRTGARVRRALSENRFDVVHVHEPLAPLVSTAAVLGASSRVVGTFHAAGDGRSLSYAFARMFMGKVHRRLDALIAVSEAARSLASRYFPGDYQIIPNGVDISRFTPGGERPQRFPPEGGPVVLFVGRNEPRKGIASVLKAFPIVAAAVDGCRLVIVGSGFDEAKVKKSVQEDLRDRITVVGFVGNEELPAYYSSADVFCAPAVGGESFGLVLIESIASGTPVVASDIPGYSGVVEQTGGGMLFTAGDPGALAGALVDLLSDEQKRRGLANAGLDRVKAFSWEQLAKRLESVYLGQAAAPG